MFASTKVMLLSIIKRNNHVKDLWALGNMNHRRKGFISRAASLKLDMYPFVPEIDNFSMNFKR
jgi:hypothetical protein